MSTYYVKRGDVGSSTPTTELLDSDRKAANLTEASVRFIMAADVGIAPTVAADAEVVGDEIDGCVRYTWVEGDLDISGHYLAEYEVTYADDSVETFPSDGYISVIVRADLDADES